MGRAAATEGPLTRTGSAVVDRRYTLAPMRGASLVQDLSGWCDTFIEPNLDAFATTLDSFTHEIQALSFVWPPAEADSLLRRRLTESLLRHNAVVAEENHWVVLQAAIDRGRSSVADVLDDEDLAVSPVVLAAVFDRASALTRQLWKAALDLGARPTTPVLSPLLEGSIDIYFRSSDLRLLVNVPGEMQDATFSGRRADGAIRGTLSANATSLDYLGAWLLGR